MATNFGSGLIHHNLVTYDENVALALSIYLCSYSLLDYIPEIVFTGE